MAYNSRTRLFFLLILVLPLIILIPRINTTGETVLEADRLEITAEKTVARGNVELTRNKLSLGSDFLELERGEDTDRISARGAVKLESGDFTARAESLSATLGKGGIVDITLSRGRGENGSLGYRGEEVKLKLDDGELLELNLREKAELTFGEDSALSGRDISIAASESGWKLEASGDLEYKSGDTELITSGITGRIVSDGETEETRLTDFKAESPLGELGLNGSSTEAGGLRFSGETASFGFDGDSTLSGVEFTNGSFTHCEECECGTNCAYSIGSERTSVVEGDFILARSARIMTFGLPVWQSPLYFIPLKDYGLPERSYFPRIGFSTEDGLSFSGAAPLYVNKNNFGNVRADYSTRTEGIGVGLDFYSGGDDLNGLGEFYGLYRSTGSNYLSADASLKTTVSEWLGLTADLDYRKGPYRGRDYDRNEWSFGLKAAEPGPGWNLTAAREEKPGTSNEDGEDTIRVVERFPELSTNWEEPLGFLPFKNEFRADLGYYRERMSRDSNVFSAAKAGFDWGFSTEITPIEGFSIPLSGGGGIDQYLNPESGELETRGRENLTPGLKLEGPGTLELTLDHTAKTGESPFEFDRITPKNWLNFDYSSDNGGVRQNLNFQYYFPPGNGFSDMEYVVSFGKGQLDQAFALEHSLSRGELKSIGTTTLYSLSDFVFELSTGYDFTSEEIVKSGLGFSFHRGENDLEFQLTGKPLQTWLTGLSADINLKLFDSWTLELSGKYDFGKGSISNLSYSIRNRLQNCLEVGITGGKSGLWFDVQLVGF